MTKKHWTAMSLVGTSRGILKWLNATVSARNNLRLALAWQGRYEDAAASLGAGQWTVFRRVTVPMILPALIAGAALAWARALGEFGATITFAGNIQGRDLTQYDFTPQQYDALIKLTAALCKIFPKIKCEYPVDASGKLITQKLPDDQLARYQGILGHYHIQTDKVDPGPALQWDLVIGEARKRLERPQ